MKKLLLIIIFGILLVGIVTAGIGLTPHNPIIKVSDKTYNQLSKMKLNNIEKSDCVKMNKDNCEFKMFNKKYNLGTYEIPVRECIDEECLTYYYYTEEELKLMIEDKIKQVLEDFTDVSIKRETTYNEPLVGGGTITVNKK